MTNKEAIQIIEKWVGCEKSTDCFGVEGFCVECEYYCSNKDFVSALKVAIEALEKIEKYEEICEYEEMDKFLEDLMMLSL